MTIINANPSKQRLPEAEDVIDQAVAAGDYVGTTSQKGGQVWHFDGMKAVRIGIPDPDERSMAVLREGDTLRVALQRVPMFIDTDFVLHRMELAPGAYYPRMSRPIDQHPTEAPGMLPNFGQQAHVLVNALNNMRSLVRLLNEIFQVVHPIDLNMNCFGGAVRNLLILACTECETQFRGILSANNALPDRPSTVDYVKLKTAMRLGEYSVRLQNYPWLDPVRPFSDWNAESPTKSLMWYDDYNASKHDREKEFYRSKIISAIHAVSAAWIMISAQFGIHGIREFRDLNEYFHLETVPLWRFSEVYTLAYQGNKPKIEEVFYRFR